MSTANGHGPTEASPPPYLPPSLMASYRLTIGKNKLWHVYSCIMLIKRHPMVAYTTGPTRESQVPSARSVRAEAQTLPLETLLGPGLWPRPQLSPSRGLVAFILTFKLIDRF